MEPTEALIQAELSLRNLVRTVLGDEWRTLPGLPDQETLDGRRQGEANSRQGVAVSQDPMDYLYIGDLKKIFDQRRGQFGEVFSDKARFNELVRILVTYRNTPFHARSLTWFESDLLTGAAGWLVANITHWRNAQTGREGDYPEILAVTDDTGQAFEVVRIQSYKAPDLGTLDVGQTVTLACQGVDGDGRPLIWRLFNGVPGNPLFALDEARGTAVSLRWTTSARDVSAGVALHVTLSADDDDYPRLLPHYNCDAFAAGIYAVLRPRAPKPPPRVL